MRVAEIISDFRNIQHYLASIRANPPAHEYYEEGYLVLRQCAAGAHALLSQPFDTHALYPEGNEEQEKAQLRQYASTRPLATLLLAPDTDKPFRVILDASVRRFKAQQIYLQVGAALRWLTSRNAILGSHQPQPVHQPALQQILNTLRAVSHLSVVHRSDLQPVLLAISKIYSSTPSRHLKSNVDSCIDMGNLIVWQELCSITSERVELSLRSMDTSQGKWVAEDPGLGMIQQMIQPGR